VCERIQTDRGVVIVCSRGRKQKPVACVRCGMPATLLCDAPASKELPAYHDEEHQGRCSMPLCAAHAYRVGEMDVFGFTESW
jgi:hypothetical protein